MACDVFCRVVLLAVDLSSSVPRYPPAFGLGTAQGYKQNHIICKILRVTVPEELMGQLTVSELREYAPDDGGHLDHIPSDWTGHSVLDHFSNPYHMVAAWCCLANAIPSDLRYAFEHASARDLRRTQHQLLKDHDDIAPNLVTLARALPSQSS
jgi:hypothetical protein